MLGTPVWDPIVDAVHHQLIEMAAKLTGLEESMYQPTREISALHTALKDMEEKLTHGGVEFDEWNWASPGDFHQWYLNLAGLVEALSIGWFMDAFVLLHRLDPGTVTLKEGLAQKHAVQKVNLDTDLEAHLATSFNTSYPDVFGSSRAQDEFGKTLTLYEMWKDTGHGTGLSSIIKKGIVSEKKSIKVSISFDIKNGSLKSLANLLLDTTVSWIGGFVQFAEEYHAEMLGSPSMTEKEAWQLMKDMMAQVL